MAGGVSVSIEAVFVLREVDSSGEGSVKAFVAGKSESWPGLARVARKYVITTMSALADNMRHPQFVTDAGLVGRRLPASLSSDEPKMWECWLPRSRLFQGCEPRAKGEREEAHHIAAVSSPTTTAAARVAEMRSRRDPNQCARREPGRIDAGGSWS